MQGLRHSSHLVEEGLPREWVVLRIDEGDCQVLYPTAGFGIAWWNALPSELGNAMKI